MKSMRGEQVKRKVFALLGATAVVAALVSVAAPAGAAKPKPASGEPIQFGYINATTGANAVPSTKDALQAYVDDWNQRGGHDGQPIQVNFADTGFDTGKQIAAARTFGSDPKMLGIAGAATCTATIPIFATTHIPTLVQAVNTDTCVQDPSFMFTQSPQANTLIALKWAIDEGVKHYGVIYPGLTQLRDGFVTPLENYLALHPDLGVTLTVAEVPLVATGADFDGAVAKLKAAGVTALFASTTAESGAVALQSATRNGFGPADGVRWIFPSNLYNPTVASSIPEMEGAYVVANLYPWEDTSNKHVKKMNKVIGNEVDNKDGFAAQGYQVANMLERSLKEIKGEVTREALGKLWASKPYKEFQLYLAPFTVDLTDGMSNPSGGQILTIKNGEFVPKSGFLVIPAKQFIPKQ
jgi:branched-chain amino acid transport system substrate-binding protein